VKTGHQLGRNTRHQHLRLTVIGVLFGLAPVFAVASSAAGSNPPTATSVSTPTATDTASTTLTLDQWKQRYEHDIGILADDVLLVVDDGKRARAHDTAAKVKLTLKDCRQWGRDAATARTAAPPIPQAAAQRAWVSMIGASSRAAYDCVASLTRGSRASAKDFPKQVVVVNRDEAILVRTFNG
jgi:hypothetical protein